REPALPGRVHRPPAVAGADTAEESGHSLPGQRGGADEATDSEDWRGPSRAALLSRLRIVAPSALGPILDAARAKALVKESLDEFHRLPLKLTREVEESAARGAVFGVAR